MWLPQTIIVQSSSTNRATPTNTALATTLPKVDPDWYNNLGSASTTSASRNSGVFQYRRSDTSPKVKSTTAGIVVGAAGAAAAYGAAMFFIARRYKKRKLSHRRSNSLMNPAEMRPIWCYTGGAFMSGGRMTPGAGGNDRDSGGSGRSAGNSLELNKSQHQ
ncbi:hypothetical protein DID88_005450 [Monilinia fructigena]|uniref:Uncharacterized protein n=1 Tax=Monilinia fructigena TaxID=38457 RepID=A0A395IZT4_9HELO|nr:hypothetical protein DID88_005450 [Monilinia fructigena]